MFTATATFIDQTKRVLVATERAQFKNFNHAAARIMKDARASIKTSDVPSQVGEPPHTRAERGHNLRQAIRYDANKTDAVIGPFYSIVGESGAAHELGAIFKGEQFDPRPFMVPAMKRNLDRFHASWAGSIGE